MYILLDIDGVLVITPPWRPVEIETDGFFKFNEVAVKNLNFLIHENKASIVLTTSHRIKYSLKKWKVLFNNRGIFPLNISKVNKVSIIENILDRDLEIELWVKQHPKEDYIIIDNDLRINNLSKEIRKRCILTKSLIGLDDIALLSFLDITE